jgi:hypothetical protein
VANSFFLDSSSLAKRYVPEKGSKVPVGNRLALSSFPLIVAHSINSTDAITLKSVLAIARRLRKAGGTGNTHRRITRRSQYLS